MKDSRSWQRLLRPPMLYLSIGVVLAAIALPIVLVQRGARTPTLANSCVVPAATIAGSSVNFKPDLIYQVVLDRFFDGNPANNDPAGDTGLYNASHSLWKDYWGGDLAGLTQKIPYVVGLGATAIWLSPVVENVHVPVIYDQPNAGYHGYWARDFYRIDPHLGTWADFDTLVQTAHQHGVKIIVDFAPNHTNPSTLGEQGAIYRDGVLQATYADDPNGWFHHNGAVNFGSADPFNLKYKNLYDLADFAQENPAVDAYLKGAAQRLLAHGIDGFRIDAVKHMPTGWLTTLADSVESQGPHYLTGEWSIPDTSDPTYPAATRFVNESGISILNYPLYTALNQVYAGTTGTYVIDDTIKQEQHDFMWLNDQPIFIDNHDNPRFLSLNPSQAALHDGLAVALTLPGIPIVYYGTEQYLHNDSLTSDGTTGGDPYNRPMMASFGTTTPAYQLIHCLAGLRHANPALAYGDYQALNTGHDVFVFQRQFGANVVVVAVNRSAKKNYSIPNLTAHLPAGTYTDFLRGQFGGTSLTVATTGTLNSFQMKPNAIAVWQYTAPAAMAPLIGGVGPELAHPGEQLTISGQGFGTQGYVTIGKATYPADSWSPQTITVTLPQDVPVGSHDLTVTNTAASGTLVSAPYKVHIASGPQIPITFTVTGLPALQSGDAVYLTGPSVELGAGVVTRTAAVGPLLSPDNIPRQFILASVTACQPLAFQFAVIHGDGSVTRESAMHQFTVPCAGESAVMVGWQG